MLLADIVLSTNLLIYLLENDKKCQKTAQTVRRPFRDWIRSQTDDDKVVRGGRFPSAVCAGVGHSPHEFDAPPPHTAPSSLCLTDPNHNNVYITYAHYFNILGIVWRDHITNDDAMTQTALHDTVPTRRRRSIGHILRGCDFRQ